MVVPPTSSRHFGSESVSGLSRVAVPAASRIARMFDASSLPTTREPSRSIRAIDRRQLCRAAAFGDELRVREHPAPAIDASKLGLAERALAAVHRARRNDADDRAVAGQRR